jgi:transcriptional regulator with XRE-family HTH domain
MPTENPHPVDIHVGTTLRRQRCYAGMSQTELAESVGITFQQLQKYESATNRVSASRLWEFSEVLGAPVEFFFPPANETRSGPAWLDDPGFSQWVRVYHDTPEDRRASFLKVVKVMPKERL